MSWGLESLGSGMANLPQGPAGRQHKRDQHYNTDIQTMFGQNSLLWKAKQLRMLGINPAVLAGSEGSRAVGMAGMGGGAGNIGAGLGQLGNKLIDLITNKETRTLKNDSIRADINYKNASADAIRMSGRTPSVQDGSVQIKPSESVSASKSNPGIEAASKVGDAISVRRDKTLKIHANQELAEALESQSGIDNVMDNWNDLVTVKNMALNKNKIRTHMRKTAINVLRSTGRLHPGTTVYWVPGRQRFQIQRIRSLKKHSRTPLRRLKNKMMKHRRHYDRRPFGGDIGS